MKKDIGIHWRKSLIFTVILILLMLTLSISVVRWINYIEEDFSFEQLHGEAARAARDVQLYAQSDRDQLEMLAVLVAAYDNPASPELWRLLSSYETIGTMHDVALLLPDNTIITGSRQKINVEGRISFEEEAARGAHISNREASVTGTEDYVIRHYVPVIRNGKTTAMLYGVIRLNELAQTMSGTLGRKDAATYLIDGKTGDFLLDTWHKSTGNIWELGEREMAQMMLLFAKFRVMVGKNIIPHAEGAYFAARDNSWYGEDYKLPVYDYGNCYCVEVPCSVLFESEQYDVSHIVFVKNIGL